MRSLVFALSVFSLGDVNFISHSNTYPGNVLKEFQTFSEQKLPDSLSSRQNKKLENVECSVGEEVDIPGGYINECMLLNSRSFNIENQKPVIIQQNWIFQSERFSTGVSVWNSAVILAKYMQQLGSSFWSGKNVIELGCGAGLASIVANRLGADFVLATDRDEEVLQLAKYNVNVNSDPTRTGALNVQKLAWGSSDIEQISKAIRWDIIIGSDLTYNSQTWRLLLETVSELGAESQARFLYASHERYSGELQSFRIVAESLGFHWEEVLLPNDFSLGSNVKIIWISNHIY